MLNELRKDESIYVMMNDTLTIFSVVNCGLPKYRPGMVYADLTGIKYNDTYIYVCAHGFNYRSGFGNKRCSMDQVWEDEDEDLVCDGK